MPAILVEGQVPSPAALLNLVTASFASFLLSTYFSIFLYGLSVHQTYRYFRCFPSDAVYIKWLVICVMALETVHLVGTIDVCYYYLVLHYGNSGALINMRWSVETSPVWTALIAIVSQLFFIRRVSLITPKYRIIIGVVVFGLLSELVLAFVALAAIIMPSFTAKEAAMYGAAAFGLASLAEVALGTTLGYSIWRSRRGRPRPPSETWVDVVQLYVINTGAATCVVDLITFLVGLALPPAETLVFASFASITTRLYGNTFLAVLNSRQQRGMEFVIDGDRKISIMQAQKAAKLDLWNAPQLPEETEPKNISIQIMQESEGTRHI